ncbi:MAG: TIR domain-containing protein, partial [Candidatus Lokiarchaeota archaeon]|nr:TIR domain-containing protein [Candidatus Lokiarchaeota archaeon]
PSQQAAKIVPKPEPKPEPKAEPEPVKAEPPPPKPKKKQRPNFAPGSNEEKVMQHIQAFGTTQHGMMKKTMEMGISFAAKTGAIGPYLDVLIDVPNWGTDLEIMSACELLGLIGKYNASGATTLGKVLKHSNPYVREKAAEALVKMKKNAAPAQAALLEATKDVSPNVSKLAYQALKNFKKMSKEEKKRIEFIAQQEKELRELQAKSQQKLQSSGDLKPKATSFDEFDNVFFMSHAVDDFPWVEKAVKEIESWPGCRCWICERDIKPGDDWMQEIYKGLSSANWFLLFWSNNSDNSKWTREEMNEAKQKNIESGGVPRVSVINLGKDEWPALFARSQSAKVLSDGDMASYLKNLRSQLGV